MGLMDGAIDKAMNKAQQILAADFNDLKDMLGQLLAEQQKTNQLLETLVSKSGPG